MVKESLKRSFCNDVMLLRSVGLAPIIVHGGGPEVAKTLARLGHEPSLGEGLRLTDVADVKVLQMVLNGAVNTELVTLLNRSGGHAVGVSGTDGALLRARKAVGERGEDLGQVGEVTSVNKAFLELLLAQGYLPVISPMGMGADGQSYHLDADAVAAEVAAALGAHKLIYLSDAPGILEGGDVVSELSAAALSERLARGVLAGGMQRKATAALRALAGGVERAHIIDGRTPHTLVAELFTDHGVGTLITPLPPPGGKG
jgi:acetylglutamate kinase